MSEQIEKSNYTIGDPSAFDHYTQFLETFTNKQEALVTDLKV